MTQRLRHQQIPALPASGDYCTGCGLCRSVCRRGAISMKENEEGFMVAHIDSSRCIQCRACETMCTRLADIHGTDNHHFYEAFHRHTETRKSSSSGGVMTALAEHTLRQGGLVFGVTMEGASRPRFIAVEKEEDLPLIRNSKYAQADTTTIMQQLKEAAQSGRRVLLAGVACQVRAARALLGHRYPNVLLVDLACFGTPSFRLFRSFLMEKRIPEQEVAHVNFRDKCSGWRSYSMTIDMRGGEKHVWKNCENPFMKAFLSKLGLNKCCYSCRAGLDERPGDLTLGDFWGRSVQPDEQDGVSMIITHTEKGEAALEAIATTIQIKQAKQEDILKANGGIADHHQPLPKTRRFFLKEASRCGLTALLQRFTDRGRARRGIAVRERFFPLPRLLDRILHRFSVYLRSHG